MVGVVVVVVVVPALGAIGEKGVLSYCLDKPRVAQTLPLPLTKWGQGRSKITHGAVHRPRPLSNALLGVLIGD